MLDEVQYELREQYRAKGMEVPTEEPVEDEEDNQKEGDPMEGVETATKTLGRLSLKDMRAQGLTGKDMIEKLGKGFGRPSPSCYTLPSDRCYIFPSGRP